jgi:Ricin-type beta-trefoil lectin domain/Glycosyl hydrolases family 18
MRSPRTIRATLTVAATALAALGLTALGSGGAQAATATNAAAATTATPLPAHVFAPYWEQYSGDNPETESLDSGSPYLTAAFLQTASAGSCTAYWDGDTSQPISTSTYGSEFAAIQAAGGNVIPSFGGAAADSDGEDIADSCTSVSGIAQVYENVITTYNVPRIDLDIEQNSLTDTAGIQRRNEAVAEVEQWAAANGRSIQFSYTVPATTTGLDSTEEAIVQNAISVGATISVVNLMTFDYYIGTEQNMQTDTESAASGLESELASLYPGDSASELWDMIGITEMPGIDDYGPDETFTTAEAAPVLSWAESHGVNTLSFWAIERDNGGCPGTAGEDDCSGISQSTWFFSNTFKAFTSGGGTSGTGGTIVGAASGKCLGDVGGVTTLKTAADIYTCNGTTPQSWTAESNGTLVNGDGLCLSITGSSTSPGAVADIYTCNGSASEQWTVKSGGTIVNNNSGLCLSVTGGATANDSTADIYTCNGSASENWTVSS